MGAQLGRCGVWLSLLSEPKVALGHSFSKTGGESTPLAPCQPLGSTSLNVPYPCSEKAGCVYTGTGPGACRGVCLDVSHDEDRVRVCIWRLEQKKNKIKKSIKH